MKSIWPWQKLATLCGKWSLAQKRLHCGVHTLFNTYHQDYADGGILQIWIWKDEKGVPTNTYSLADGIEYQPKPAHIADVAYKFHNFRARKLSEVWKEALPMMEPIDADGSSDSRPH